MAPKTPQRRLTACERARIHSLRYNAGWNYAQISRRLEIPYRTVRECALGPITPQKQRGRLPILNTPLRQRLIAHATASHEQRLKPLREIAYELGIYVDHRTLTKAFDKEGYHRRCATEKPLLQPKDLTNRLLWSSLAIHWPPNIWHRIIWSDEAAFRIGRGKCYVTRQAEEKYNKDCCVPKFKDFTTLFVWACIGGDGSKGPLVIWDRDEWGNWNSASYTQRIFPYIRSVVQEHEIFRVGIGNALFMQDGASPHRAIATKKMFDSHAIRLLWWPANSPDLNPIKNLWRLLKKRVQDRFPTSKEELRRVIEEEWAKITIQDIKKYTDTMHERCQAVQKAEGGHIPY
jgi:transposase